MDGSVRVSDVGNIVRTALKFAIAAVAALSVSSTAMAATPIFAVYLDGATGPNTNGILSSLDHSFGLGSYNLLTTAQLDTVGTLNSYQSIIVSRSGSSFGGGLDATAAANIKAYVGSGASQGGVAVFTNDAADNLFGATGGDPFDANLDRLFVNAATFAAASGHGYIGEFNGAVDAFASNSAGFSALGLLQGSASAVHGYDGGVFTYGVGPIGSGNPIDAGVTFPFTDSDHSTFLTDVTNPNSSNVVDIYTSSGINGEAAVLANDFVIRGGGSPGVPEPATWAMMLVGFGGLGAVLRHRRTQASCAAA